MCPVCSVNHVTSLYPSLTLALWEREWMRVDRKCECKSRSFPHFAFHPNLAAMQFDELPRQRQSEPGAFALVGVIRTNLAEFFKDRLLVFPCDADAGVSN